MMLSFLLLSTVISLVLCLVNHGHLQPTYVNSNSLPRARTKYEKIQEDIFTPRSHSS